MTENPKKDIDRSKRKVEPRPKPKDREPPSKQTDRSRHMSWGNDDVEHHGSHDSEGTRYLESFNAWRKGPVLT
jgi:hypothetical protein